MAFDSDTLSLIASPLAGGRGRIWSCVINDDEEVVIGAGYFANIAHYGVKVGDIVICVNTIGGNGVIVSMIAFDSAGNGTADQIEDIASQAEAEAGADNHRLMTPLRTYQEITARLASQVEAETGTDNIKLQTALRVAQQTTARLATQAQAEAGADAFKLITPQQMTQGIRANDTPKMSAAIGDAVTDDSAAVQTVASAAYTAKTPFRQRGSGRYLLNTQVTLANSGTTPLIMDGDGVYSSFVVNNVTGGFKYTSGNARAFVYAKDLIIEPGTAGCGPLFEIDMARATITSMAVRLHHLKLAPQVDTNAFWSTGYLIVSAANRMRLTDSLIAPGANAVVGETGVQVDLPECYYPQLYYNRIVGGRANIGVRLKNATQDTEGVGFNDNQFVGSAYGVWIERCQGSAPTVELSRNYFANRLENLHLDGLKYGFATGNQYYCGSGPDYTWVWSGTTLTLTTSDSIAHQLTASNYAQFKATGAGTDWLTTTAYVLGNRVFNADQLYYCLVGHTSGTFATDLAAGKWTAEVPISTTPTAITFTFTMKNSGAGSGAVVWDHSNGFFYDVNFLSGSGMALQGLYRFDERRGRRHVRMEPGGTLKAAWVALTPYALGDYVTNGGNVYKCNTAHTSGGVFSSTNWQTIAVQNLRLGPDLLHGASDVAPYYIGPGCQQIFVHLPWFVPAYDSAKYNTPTALVEVDASVANSDVLVRDDLDVLHGWQDLASASTATLNTLPSKYINITGSVTIASFGTAPAGRTKILKFASAPTLTYNATSMVLPGAADIAAAAGDIAHFMSNGSGNWYCTRYQLAARTPKGYLQGQVNYDPPSLADGAEDTKVVTVTGAVLGDFAVASFSLSLQGIMISAAVTASNTVTVTVLNKTGGVLDISTGVLLARVYPQ